MRDRRLFKHQPGNTGSHTLGWLVEQAREEHGLSRLELSEAIGVSKSMVAKIEQGKRPVTNLETAIALSEALHMSVDMIYSVQGIPPPDVMELLEKGVGLHVKRVRWALQKIADGEMFDEELREAGKVAGDLPGPAIIPRQRTAREQRAWKAEQEARRLAEEVIAPPPTTLTAVAE